MKRFFAQITGILLYLQLQQLSYAQQLKQTWIEDFDSSPVSFTATPIGSWKSNTVYHLSGTSSSSPKSYQGLVANLPGDSTILETPQYDCSLYDYVFLRFHHICKISPQDVARIEYRIISVIPGAWQPLPSISYWGGADNYGTRNFNAASYPEWNANDNFALPDPSWWKEEGFDLTFNAANRTVQFRFILKHGATHGTQVAYGWLLENFQLEAASYPLRPPSVQLIKPYVKGTVYGTGAWEINAKVKTNTIARIHTPHLIYTATQKGITIQSDTLLMTHVGGDSLWKTSIPQFVVGTKVSYTVEGWDTLGNTATASLEYIVTSFVGVSEYVYFGAEDSINGQQVQSLVLFHGATNSWSRHLYLHEELKDITEREDVLINHLAFKVTGLPTDRTLIRIYLKATNQTIQPRYYMNPVFDKASLVYEGSLHFVFSDDKITSYRYI